jgi:hypothetical protein
MKYLLLIVGLVTLSSCGGGGGAAGGTSIPDGAGNPAGVKTWTMEITGDGVGYVMNLTADQGDADEEFLSAGPLVLGVGQTVTYTVTGRTLDNASFARTSGTNVTSGGPWVVFTLYENGTAVEVQQLSTNGTFGAFQNR